MWEKKFEVRLWLIFLPPISYSFKLFYVFRPLNLSLIFVTDMRNEYKNRVQKITTLMCEKRKNAGNGKIP